MSHFELKIPYHLTRCHFTLPLSLRVRPPAGVVTETHQPADRTCTKFHGTVGRSTEHYMRTAHNAFSALAFNLW